MGCGTSKAVQAIEEDLTSKSPTRSEVKEQKEKEEELTSVRSNTPDQTSKPIDPPPHVIQSNGTDPSAPPIENNGLPEAPPISGLTPPLSGKKKHNVNKTGLGCVRYHPCLSPNTHLSQRYIFLWYDYGTVSIHDIFQFHTKDSDVVRVKGRKGHMPQKPLQ